MPAGQSSIASIKLTFYGSNVYEPSDDSFALVDALKAAVKHWSGDPPRLGLEIGSGSGYVICSLALLLRQLGPSAALLLATDVNPQAAAATVATLLAHGVAGNADVVLTDLASALQPRLHGLVDLLVFNPPYVPTPDEEVLAGGIAAAWAGGSRGRRVIDRVLPLVPQLLSPRGQMFMVTVAENEPQEILQHMAALGFAGRVALQRGADEELLSILHFQRKEEQQQQQQQQQQQVVKLNAGQEAEAGRLTPAVGTHAAAAARGQALPQAGGPAADTQQKLASSADSI